METRTLKLIKNKDGHGSMGYKVNLPKSWVEAMGVTDTVDLKFDNNEITIYKEEGTVKLVKKDLSHSKFETYVHEFEKELLNTKGVVRILTSNIDTEIPYSGGIFRREYWGKGSRNGTVLKKDLLYTENYSEKYETYVFNIYKYVK